MKIAIVGSQEKYWKQNQREKVVKQIKKILTSHIVVTGPAHYGETKYPVLISGGCPYGGVDIWAEVIADVLGIPKDIKHPEIRSWEDSEYEDSPVPLSRKPKVGYRDRNITIAKECDVLYCFDPEGRDWSGGQWTYHYANRLGKEVHLIEVS